MIFRDLIRRDQRPYDVTRMGPVDWRDVSQHRIQIKSLVATDAAALLKAMTQRYEPASNPPKVVLYQGTFYLEAGHDVALFAAMRGQTTVSAHLLYYSPKKEAACSPSS